MEVIRDLNRVSWGLGRSLGVTKVFLGLNKFTGVHREVLWEVIWRLKEVTLGVTWGIKEVIWGLREVTWGDIKVFLGFREVP